MSKYYFDSDEGESCYKIEHFKDVLRFNEQREIELIEAEMEKGQDHFYCSFFGEVGLIGEGCGKECSEYKPRNGKNGRCRFSNNCYTHSSKKVLLTKITDKKFILKP